MVVPSFLLGVTLRYNASFSGLPPQTEAAERYARRTRGNCKVFQLLATNPMKRRDQAACENAKGHL